MTAGPAAPKVREYREGDEDGINAVIKSVFDEYGWLWDPKTENKDTYAIRENYHDRGGGFWVLEADGQIVGTVALRAKEGDTCTLYRVYVPAHERGRGYGRSLFRFAIGQARHMGFRKMEIWSDKTLDVSHVMYKNAGAKVIGDRKVFDPDYGVPYEEWGYLLDLDSIVGES